MWRFAHDKLREGVIASIAIPERPGLHRLIAETIEMLYEDNPDYTLPLALHWREAGDEARDMHYSSLAGSQILRQGIVSEAVSLLERAHRLGQRLPHDDLWYARLCHSLTEATIAIGRPQQSFAYLLEAIKTLKVPTLPPAATVDEVLSRPIAIDLSGYSQDARLLIHDIYMSLAYNYMEISAQTLEGIETVLTAAAMQEPFGPSLALADAYALQAYALQLAGVPEQAALAAERAAVILVPMSEEDESQLPTMARALSNLAFYWTFAARWNESLRDGQRAARLYQRTGDPLRSRATLMNLAVTYEWQGDFKRGMELRQREYETALRGNTIYGQVRALAGVGQLQAYMGDLDASVASLEHRAELVHILDNPTSTRYTYLGMIYWKLGRLDEAVAVLGRALNEVRRIMLPTGHDLFSIPNTAEVLLGVWETTPEKAMPFLDDAPMVYRLLHDYALRYASGESHMTVFMGRFAWLRGDHEEAMRLWRHAVEVGATRGTPYAQALARLEIGRHLPATDATRLPHLIKARDLFEAIGTTYDLSRVNRELNS